MGARKKAAKKRSTRAEERRELRLACESARDHVRDAAARLRAAWLSVDNAHARSRLASARALATAIDWALYDVSSQPNNVEGNPLRDASKAVSDYLRECGVNPPLLTRAQWAVHARGLLEKELVQRHGSLEKTAEACATAIVVAFDAAAEVPQLAVISKPSSFFLRSSKARQSILRYLLSVESPDPEAILRRGLVGFGYEARSARSLFEHESVREKRAADRSTSVGSSRRRTKRA